jgi:4-hydroxybenzoate polyprenyltransferase
MVRKALAINPRLQVLAPYPSFAISVGKSLRSHQWVKNLLLLVPLFSAHAWDQPLPWLWAFVGMAAFSLLSSAVYLLNDLHDLEVDRAHPFKRTRPLAKGELTIPEGLALAVVFLGGSLGAAWFLGQGFFLCAAIYLAMALIYNGWAKGQAGLDLIGLASFYTLRILAGGAAAGIACSPWLLGYAIFLFLSLACVKRVSELRRLKEERKIHAGGRGYAVADLEGVTAIGIASGVVSVLVAALYVNSADVKLLYAQPQFLWLLCPILFYWVIRVWLKTLRGQMPEDPVLFALKDRASWLLLFLVLLVGAGASR